MATYFGKNLKFLRNEKALNQQALADLTGRKFNTIGNWENEKTEPSFEELTAIVKFFDVSVDEILFTDLSKGKATENGKIQKTDKKGKAIGKVNGKLTRENTARMPQVITVDKSGNETIILVPSRARAGYLAGYEDPEFISGLPTYSLPNMAHGTHRMFEVFGHSMVPTFHESDIIIGRYVDNLLEIRDDRVYVVVTKSDGIVVKRVLNRIQRDGKLILNSDNQRHAGEYPPIVVNPEEVLEIWYAVAYMSRQMRRPGEIINDIIDIKARLTLVEDVTKKLLAK